MCFYRYGARIVTFPHNIICNQFLKLSNTIMIQKEFAARVTGLIKNDKAIIGLAAAGSWLTDELDEYSDLDLILVTKEKIGGNREAMLSMAQQYGKLLAGFTGEHVGEPRVLICLYDDPLLHVDLKFLTLEELVPRVETPAILLDKTGQIEEALRFSDAKFPYPDYQWIEDRFWIWIHYALAKIGRGEYMEAIDFLAYLRATVLGPMMLIKNGNLPKGVRKVEMLLDPADLIPLKQTLAVYDRQSLISAVENCILSYQQLRKNLFEGIQLKTQAEARVLQFFNEVKRM